MALTEFEVTPWEVSGNIDYEKLTKQFGTEKIGKTLKEKLEKHAKEKNVMLHRDFFFSHRDLNLVLEDYDKGRGFFLYTGRGPSGPMHIGHLVPLIFTKWLQDVFGVNVYIEITDDEKFWVKDITWAEIQKYSEENIKDIVAVGFDPDKTFIFRDSEYVGKVYPLMIKAAKKITHSTAKAVFGFSGETNLGLTFYPVYQIVPTFFEKKRCLIPCAIDQDPYWRIQRDIAEKLGYEKTAAIHSKFLPPLTGIQGKMSASVADTAIWLNDDEKTVKNKVNKYAFSGGRETVEEHRKLGGNPEVDVSFQWLKILFEPEDKKIDEIGGNYRSGKILSGEMKQILIVKVNEFLTEHRKKREKIDVKKFTHTGKLAKEMWEKKFIF